MSAETDRYRIEADCADALVARCEQAAREREIAHLDSVGESRARLDAEARLRQTEQALRFWVSRADYFEQFLPASHAYAKARGVLNESYAVGRAALDAQPAEEKP